MVVMFFIVAMTTRMCMVEPETMATILRA